MDREYILSSNHLGSLIPKRFFELKKEAKLDGIKPDDPAFILRLKFFDEAGIYQNESLR